MALTFEESMITETPEGQVSPAQVAKLFEPGQPLAPQRMRSIEDDRPQKSYLQAAKEMPKAQLRQMAVDIADHYGIPRDFFMGLIRTESSWNPGAIGKMTKYGQARGLGQIIPGTAAELGLNVTNDEWDERYHPGKNLDAAARYLVKLKEKSGSWKAATGGYYGKLDQGYINSVIANADKEIAEPLVKPNPILVGWKSGASGFYNLMANISKVMDVVSRTMSLDFLSEPYRRPESPEMLQEGVVSPLSGYERPFAAAEEFLRGKAREVAPWPEDMPGGVVRKTVAGLASAPFAIAQYATFMRLFGTIGGFSMVDGLSALDQGPIAAVLGAAKGAATGVGFKAVEPLTYMSRLMGLGTIGAVTAAAEGHGPEDMIASAATLMALGAMHYGGGNLTISRAFEDAIEQFRPKWDSIKKRAELVKQIEQDLTDMANLGHQNAAEVKEARRAISEQEGYLQQKMTEYKARKAEPAPPESPVPPPGVKVAGEGKGAKAIGEEPGFLEQRYAELRKQRPPAQIETPVKVGPAPPPGEAAPPAAKQAWKMEMAKKLGMTEEALSDRLPKDLNELLKPEHRQLPIAKAFKEVLAEYPDLAAKYWGGEPISPAAVKYSENIQQGMKDWLEGNLYLDNAGNYRLKTKEGKKIAPYNKELKKIFPQAERIHEAAQEAFPEIVAEQAARKADRLKLLGEPLTPATAKASDGDILLSSGLNIEQFKLFNRVAHQVVDAGYEMVKKYIPPAHHRNIDMWAITRFITLPRTIVEKYPEFKPWYDGWLKKQDVLTFEGNKGYEALSPYMELKGKSRERVDRVLRDMDRVNSEAEHTEVTRLGPEYYLKKGLNPQEAKAAWEIRQGLDRVKSEIMRRFNEDHLTYLTGHGLDPAKAQEMLDRIAYTGDPLYDPNPATGSGGGIIADYFGPDVNAWPRTVVNHFKKYRDNMQVWIKEHNNYIPHEFRGPHFLYVKEGDNLLDVYAAPTWIGLTAKIAEAKGIYGEEGIQYVTRRKGRLPMELYMEADIPKTAALMQAAREKMPGDVQEQMLKIWQDFLLEKGWGAHHISRKGYEGYEKDLAGPLARYFSGYAGYVSKMGLMRDFTKAWEGTDMKALELKPNLTRYMLDYETYLLSNPQEFGRLRNLMWHFTLAGDMTFYFVNAMQNIHTGWAALGTITNSPLLKLTRAWKDWAQYKATGTGLTAEEVRALETARQESAVLAPQFARETASYAYSPLYRAAFARETRTGRALEFMRDIPGVRTGMDVLRSFWYGDAIERMNRESLFIAVFRETKNINEALRLTTEGHFPYGRGDKPQIGRGIGAPITQFQNFSFNYFKLMKGFLKEGDAAGLARMLAGSIVTGGLFGSIIGAPLRYAYKKAFGKDVEDEAKHYFQELLGDDAGTAVNRGIWRGLPAAALGIDISGRIAPNLPMGLDRLAPDEKSWEKTLVKVLGASTMFLQKGFNAAEAFSKGDVYRMLEYLSPRSVQNAMAAYRLGTKGAMTLSGQPIYTTDLEPLKLTPGEMARKFAGAQPIRLAEHYARKQYFIDMDKERRNTLDRIATMYSWGLRTGDAAMTDKALAEWGDYNRRCIDQGRFVDMIKTESFNQAVKMRGKPKYPDKSAKRTLMREAQ